MNHTGLLTFAATAMVPYAAFAQSLSIVVPQVPASATALSEATKLVTTETTAANPISREDVESCREAELGTGAAPDGVDCAAILKQVAEARLAASAEGSLLSLLGQNNSVTTRPSSSRNGSVDADAVARELSSGDIQAGSTSMEAAGIVARQRGTTPPPQ